MKNKIIKKFIPAYLLLLLGIVIILPAPQLLAQNRNGGAPRAGANRNSTYKIKKSNFGNVEWIEQLQNMKLKLWQSATD